MVGLRDINVIQSIRQYQVLEVIVFDIFTHLNIVFPGNIDRSQGQSLAMVFLMQDYPGAKGLFPILGGGIAVGISLISTISGLE